MVAMTAQQGAEVAVIGLGVIGGSAALRMRDRGTALRTFSASAADRAGASAAGIAVAPSLDEAVSDVGLVLIAVPLDKTSSVAEQVLGCAPPKATILHAASLQRTEALRGMPEVMARLIGTHPLAGSHRSSFIAARADLFHDATVCIERRADARQREDAEMFWSLAGARRIEYATASDMKVHGALRVPDVKSISHRAIMLAALGDGTSRITGILESADVASTAEVLRRLGAAIPPLAPDIIVDGVGLRGLRAPTDVLD